MDFLPGVLGQKRLFSAAILLCSLACVGAWTGTIQDVQHVVIFVQENRSFDHYFGTFNGVRGFGDPAAIALPNGDSVLAQPQGGSYLLPFQITNQCMGDVDHEWSGTHAAWDFGRWDAWVTAKGAYTMEYFAGASLPYYRALADAYTICDDYHCSVMGPTVPNRLYIWTGMIDPAGTAGGPISNNAVPPSGLTWTTYAERLQAVGISWRVYQQSVEYFGGNGLTYFTQFRNAQSGNPLYDRGVAQVPDVVQAFQHDVTNGTLPRVSWIVGPYSSSEHPPFSTASGQAFTKQLIDALASNPEVCNSTVFLFTYDENGGFFDHVPSPVPANGTPDEFIGGLPIGLGARVPMLIVSPWTRGGYVCSQVFDHTSILRFLEACTGVQEPNISAWRRQVCGDLTAAFDFANPDTSIPSLPSVTPIACSTGTVDPLPTTQLLPVQEAGTRPARPLPYQLNATSSANCSIGNFSIQMTNAGTASAHFAIYPKFQTNAPWQYDVSPGSSASFSLYLGGLYDLTCYGPDGFVRSFSGNLQTNCGLVEATSSIDASAGSITITMQNSSDSPVTFGLANAYVSGGPWSYNVPANSSVSNTTSAVTNNGVYDIVAVYDADQSFKRRFAGRIETIPPPPPPPPPAGPILSATGSNDTLVLTYPSSPFSYALQSSTNLAIGSWVPATALSNFDGSNITLILPMDSETMYFRLSR